MDRNMPADAVDIELLKKHPEKYPDLSVTQQYTLPYETVMDIQLAVLKERFSHLVDKVAVLGKLAETQGVKEIRDFNDAAVLLFPHSLYKSYPLALLEKSRFDLLTKWLDTMTSIDLSSVDASGCAGIDDWLDVMDTQTELRIKHSSGTTGKLSFVPRTLAETEATAKGWRRSFEGFAGEPHEHALAGFEDLHVILISYRKGALAYPRMMDAAVHWLYGGDESRIVASNSGRMSADVLSLGGRLQAAQAKGELGQLQISPTLLARRDAFMKEQAAQPERLKKFFGEIVERFRGKRVILVGSPPTVYDLAVEARRNGLTDLFTADSLAMFGGGAKGRKFDEDYQQAIAKFVGMPRWPLDGYGMSEMCIGSSRMCMHGNVHPLPSLIPFLFDPKTGELLPREGTQTGRYGWFDLAIQTHWGGLLSGDRVTMTWDKPCACGRAGPIIHSEIRRFTEIEGGDDKITCAGAMDAHDKALEFIAQAVG
ncbi:MAG TPA: hypothetical protein VMF67_16205 [Rhizomicrobium sp.]|nr:hypothetical protein [Rhizomicrobium sp.]